MLTLKATRVLPVGATASAFSYRLPAGTWRIALHYRNPDVSTDAISSPVVTVTVS